MMGRRVGVLLLTLTLAAMAIGGCARLVDGSPTWPGARLAQSVLTAADFPPGAQYNRIEDQPGQPDGQGAPPAMLSDPAICSDGLTKAIGTSAERGPGSAMQYVLAFDGARMLITILSSNIDLEAVAAVADKCSRFETFFDRSLAIPVTTESISSSRPGALTYRQTITLSTIDSSVYFSFENIGTAAVFGIAFPTPNPNIAVKATLPQTFLDIVAKQAERLAQA